MGGVYVCVFVSICAHTHEYYLASQKEILPFMTTRMKLEVLMLSEINQSENMALYHTQANHKKKKY